jgi:hypothetical protein
MPKIYPAPTPGPTSPSLQKVADQSWYGIAGVSQPPAQTPQEAIKRDPRKNPTNPKLT